MAFRHRTRARRLTEHLTVPLSEAMMGALQKECEGLAVPMAAYVRKLICDELKLQDDVVKA